MRGTASHEPGATLSNNLLSSATRSRGSKPTSGDFSCLFACSSAFKRHKEASLSKVAPHSLHTCCLGDVESVVKLALVQPQGTSSCGFDTFSASQRGQVQTKFLLDSLSSLASRLSLGGT
eukprot:gnl/TRDRNA2_/TRDRNA2_152148_c0_seq2.p2 gnl/TRDRNA2_/TRDRNA2_152148_c0~~gnl/TRDRNA2_/TRDRNA2_152148_c0_seq2.p2  ORF type:complete len:120 (-),score=16.19 gnl/TRDRNA2_/TRDRNA2_152148_c0_seq2:64-423(-)